MSLKGINRHFPVALLVVSVALNLVLAKRLVALRAVPSTAAPVGARMPALDVKALDGHRVHIGVDHEALPTVFYYFSPTCAWCAKNWDNVRVVAAAAPGHYRFIGISTTGDVADFVQSHHLNFPVYWGVSADAARVYHFGGTPQTVVVSPTGAVVHAWAGAYAAKQQKDVERYFALSLPGLIAPKP